MGGPGADIEENTGKGGVHRNACGPITGRGHQAGEPPMGPTIDGAGIIPGISVGVSGVVAGWFRLSDGLVTNSGEVDAPKVLGSSTGRAGVRGSLSLRRQRLPLPSPSPSPTTTKGGPEGL